MAKDLTLKDVDPTNIEEPIDLEIKNSEPVKEQTLEAPANNAEASLEIKEAVDAEAVTPEEPKSDVRIVKTDEGSVNGHDACPKCGSTDISVNRKNGKLRCNYCRHEFEPVKVSGLESDISKLSGKVIGSGASDIIADAKDVMTFKCSSCGSEVVIDTSNAAQARCHWCRHTLSINQQIPNGAVPDVVLPFKIERDDARASIEKFVGKRKFFANPKFKKEFTTENVMGVYFPYMLVDVNAHANYIGEGEHEIRHYTVGSGDNQQTYYDADLYHVEREFDIAINGLSIESNSDRLNNDDKTKTNNIINSIMPFDTENCVKYNANYLKGYTSEKRDVNVDKLQNVVDAQARDVMKFAANETMKTYDRGVKWETEDVKIKGEQWQAAYLPVWLYSYQEEKKNKKLLHYVAVNARTKETMGSVPIHMPKLLLVSGLLEILGFFLTVNIVDDEGSPSWIFMSIGVVFFLIMYFRYRNSDARHTYETETKKEMTNLRQVDKFIKTMKRLSNSRMNGANNRTLEGQAAVSKEFGNGSGGKKKITSKMLESATVNGVPIGGIVKKLSGKEEDK